MNATQVGLLFGLNAATGKAVKVSDVGDQMYKSTGDHKSLFPSDFPDSNPYGVLVTKDRGSGAIRTFVADTAANPAPGGTAHDSDGAMHVSINSANPAPNSGAVVKIHTKERDD